MLKQAADLREEWRFCTRTGTKPRVHLQTARRARPAGLLNSRSIYFKAAPGSPVGFPTEVHPVLDPASKSITPSSRCHSRFAVMSCTSNNGCIGLQYFFNRFCDVSGCSTALIHPTRQPQDGWGRAARMTGARGVSRTRERRHAAAKVDGDTELQARRPGASRAGRTAEGLGGGGLQLRPWSLAA